MVEILSKSFARNAIDPSFVESIPEIITALVPVVADVPEKGRRWVFYGSAPMGNSGADSDIDVLLLHDNPDAVPHRRGARLGSTPVTIYVLSRDDLMEDGKNRRFGGYFSLKLFSPFVSDLPEDDHELAEGTALFFGPFSATVDASPRSVFSSDQLLARAYLDFIEIYPDFAGYLARLAQDRDRLARVWRHQRGIHIPALCSVGLIAQVGDDQWRYAGTNLIADVARERARCAARFWAFGAVCHGANPGFPDFYFQKTESYASVREQHTAVQFLYSVSSGGVRV